ncbi:biotin/lipoyl-containing protein [Thermococcus sp. JCM 11816]|uniref:biotin/lipoyl-containing protein n=1 Tax=Thermococcus sp. (strain JCM 11816 / KS-1) TaxID=1295125 RepID=UPI0006D27245
MAKVKVIVEGVEYEVEVEELPGGKFRVSFEDKTYEVEAKGAWNRHERFSKCPGLCSGPPAPSTPPSAPSPVPAPAPAPATPSPAPAAAGEGVVTAPPMPGKILKILVKEGEQVRTGQGLLILEAMKMENEIPAPKDGVVKKILVKEGDTVNTGDPLIEIG